jgi:hypothetical protein
MTGNNSSKTSNSSDGRDEAKDRLKTRIALAVQERISPGKCPSAEDLAAFADGRLNENEEERILAHLNACANCREAWLAVSSEVDVAGGKASVIDLASRLKTRDESKDRLRRAAPEKVKAFFHLPRPLTAGLGLALAASLILVVWWALRPPQLNTLIARSYSEMETKRDLIAGETLRQALTLPWEEAETGYGFSGSPPPSEASLAFAAGLWAGREQLAARESRPVLPEALHPPSCKESASPAVWMDSPYATYYLVGQWVVMMRDACRMEEPPGASFWQRQQETLGECMAVFSGKNAGESKILAESFNGIRAPLGELAKNPADRRACSNLASELKTLTEKVAPTPAK